MDTFINVLADNYIWLIGISIFLIFALIGFLVESGSSEPKEPKPPKPAKEPKIKEVKEKPQKVKKEKPNKKNKKEDILEDNTPTIGDLMKQEEEQQKNNDVVEQLDSTQPVSDSSQPIVIEDVKQ